MGCRAPSLASSQPDASRQSPGPSSAGVGARGCASTHADPRAGEARGRSRRGPHRCWALVGRAHAARRQGRRARLSVHPTVGGRRCTGRVLGRASRASTAQASQRPQRLPLHFPPGGWSPPPPASDEYAVGRSSLPCLRAFLWSPRLSEGRGPRGGLSREGSPGRTPGAVESDPPGAGPWGGRERVRAPDVRSQGDRGEVVEFAPLHFRHGCRIPASRSRARGWQVSRTHR